MLIVEGPDGVGKTTLCKKLLKGLPGHVYAHFTRLPPGFDYHWGYADRASRRVVQDRFHMSELAYAKARGERPMLDRHGYQLIDARLRLLGAVTVVVTASAELVASRWDNSQMYSLDATLAAAREYDRVLAECPWVDVDVVLRCDQGDPYVTDHAADAVLELYLERQRAVDAVARRRPPGL